MSRARLLRALKIASIAAFVSALALLLFTEASLDTVMQDGDFWQVVAATLVGAFLGSLLFQKRMSVSHAD